MLPDEFDGLRDKRVKRNLNIVKARNLRTFLICKRIIRKLVMRQNALLISIYVILAVLEFLPIPFPARMIFPLLWLTVCAMYQRQWALTAALFFSFLGDVMGWRNELIPQIGFFALAQIVYIVILCLLRPPKTTWPLWFRIILLLLVAAVYGIAMNWIFPRVEDRFIAWGIAVYAVLLLGMCYSALRHRNACLMIGATLFVVSDFILGIHLFVQKVPHSTLCIMVPYYLGQLLLFVGMSRACAHTRYLFNMPRA